LRAQYSGQLQAAQRCREHRAPTMVVFRESMAVVTQQRACMLGHQSKAMEPVTTGHHSPTPLRHSSGTTNRAPKIPAADVMESASAKSSRKMFDKRLLRRGYRERFEDYLMAWRVQHLTERAICATPKASPKDDARVRVCVRKRPLFCHEAQEDEFDVISVRGPEVIVHNCRTKPDLKTIFVQHTGYRFSHVLDASTSNGEAYLQCAAPAVNHALDGGTSTIFMFGQTGSGKTHTMDAILQFAAGEMFGEAGPLGRDVSLSAFEIAGKTLRDLFAAPGAPSRPAIMQDDRNMTQIAGLIDLEVRSADQLLELTQRARANRVTRATQVHSASSRSHAVLRFNLGDGGAEGPGKHHSSSLTLVDCAGTERKEDSSHHDVESQKETAEINASLFALKECFRTLHSPNNSRPPYRGSFLTRVLAASFTDENAHIVAIGTVSPAASDTEHSIATLRALAQLQGTQPSLDARDEAISVRTRAHEEPHPKSWSEDDVRQWLSTALGGTARAYVSGLSNGTDGKHLVRWPTSRFVLLCCGDAVLADQLYQDLRRKVQRAV